MTVLGLCWGSCFVHKLLDEKSGDRSSWPGISGASPICLSSPMVTLCIRVPN